MCRVYRYGQRKPCCIYRLVCDFTLEKKIYDRQVSKQGMSGKRFLLVDKSPYLQWPDGHFQIFHLSKCPVLNSHICPFKDRVVDDLNPVLNFTRKEVESLLHFVEEEPEPKKISVESQEEYEAVLYQACELYPNLITKVYMRGKC